MMSAPCSKEYEFGELTANQEMIKESLIEIKADIRCLINKFNSLSLKVAGISVGISVVVYLFTQFFLHH